MNALKRGEMGERRETNPRWGADAGKLRPISWVVWRLESWVNVEAGGRQDWDYYVASHQNRPGVNLFLLENRWGRSVVDAGASFIRLGKKASATVQVLSLQLRPTPTMSWGLYLRPSASSQISHKVYLTPCAYRLADDDSKTPQDTITRWAGCIF